MAAAVTALLPDVTRDRRAAVVRDGQGHRSVLAVLRVHRRVLLTLGIRRADDLRRARDPAVDHPALG